MVNMARPACTFDLEITIKLHKNLVTKNNPPTANLPAHPTASVTLSSLRNKVMSVIGNHPVASSTGRNPQSDNAAIVTCSAKKKRILQEYKSDFGDGVTPIVTKKER